MTWGDKSFEISELPEQLNENFALTSDDIEQLEVRIKAIEDSQQGGPQVSPVNELGAKQIDAAKKRILEALAHGDYRWRSIERLASIANTTTSQTEDIIRPLDEVVLSKGKSGRSIARLRTR